MNKEKIKKYLQIYFDTILNNKFVEDSEGIKLTIHDIVEVGQFKKKLVLFIDTEPEILSTSWDIPNRVDKKLEKEILDFLNMLSITNGITIYWDKRPVFKTIGTAKKLIDVKLKNE